MSAEEYKDRLAVVRLWVHECERVLCDRLISDADIAKFHEFRVGTCRKHFDGIPQASEITPILLRLITRPSRLRQTVAYFDFGVPPITKCEA